jgi:hypothetical protein
METADLWGVTPFSLTDSINIPEEHDNSILGEEEAIEDGSRKFPETDSWSSVV